MITKWKEGEREKFKIKTPSSNEERGSQNVRSLKPKFDALSNLANLKPLTQRAQSTKCHRLFYPNHLSRPTSLISIKFLSLTLLIISQTQEKIFLFTQSKASF
ncbi:hypothetical protein V6Z12_D04G143300 [Gossypium hirsutum]